MSRIIDGELADYYKKVGTVPLLTEDDEAAIGRRVQTARRAGTIDIDARNELVRANLRFAVGIAKRYTGRGLDLADLIQEGTLGLLSAAEAYDPSKARFTTYAKYWIMHYIKRALNNKSRLIRIPEYQRRLASLWQQEALRLTDEDGRPEDGAVIAAVQKAANKRSYKHPKVETLRNLSSILRVSFLPLDKAIEDGKEGWTSELVAEVLTLMDRLPQREATVLRLRYGLTDECKPLTHQKIGECLGFTKEWSRQIEARALKRLRAALTKEC